MPPIENELAESDFNDAVTFHLYLFGLRRERKEKEWARWHRRRDDQEMAYWIAVASRGGELPTIPPPGGRSAEPERKPETVQIVVDGKRRTVPAPAPGEFYDAKGNLCGGSRPRRKEKCDPHFFVDNKCQGCDLRNDGGVLRYGPDPVECDEHEVVEGKCIRCGGWEWEPGMVTKPTPRVLGRCEHERFQVRPEGGVRCLDCGEVGC
jgi:hypothetical protein